MRNYFIVNLVLSATAVSAFSPSHLKHLASPSIVISNNHGLKNAEVQVKVTSLNMAGFGGGGGMAKKGKGNKKKGGGGAGLKLKPKPQWDRYGKLKKASAVRVAVRVANDGSEEKGQWFEVGKVKSEENNFTEIAVAMQRGIIAEVSTIYCTYCTLTSGNTS